MSNLIARKDGVMCPDCGMVEPVHAGDGTPIKTLIFAYKLVIERHSKKNHPNPFTGKKLGAKK